MWDERIALVQRLGDRYRLHPDQIGVDLWQLQTAVREVLSPVTAADRRASLRATIAAYTDTDDVGAARPWPWLEATWETVRRQLIDAYATLAAASPPGEAQALLHAAIRVDPLNEALRRQAMHALAAAGDHRPSDTVSPTTPQV